MQATKAFTEKDRRIAELEHRVKCFTEQNARLQERNIELERAINDIFKAALRIAK